MVVDGSRLVRKLIGDMLQRELAGARVVSCDALAHAVREASGQSYVPVIVVSGDVQSRLEARSLNDDVTDYFDKALGHQALAAFIRGYVHPQPVPGARVLYVEDSRVVAAATKRMLERQELEVLHFTEGEGALDYLRGGHARGVVGAALGLTDVYLKGARSGRDRRTEIENNHANLRLRMFKLSRCFRDRAAHHRRSAELLSLRFRGDRQAPDPAYGHHVQGLRVSH